MRLEDREHREVELREDRAVWPIGTRGYIVDAFPTEAVVEIMDPEGRTLDLITVGYDSLTILGTVEQQHLAL